MCTSAPSPPPPPKPAPPPPAPPPVAVQAEQPIDSQESRRRAARLGTAQLRIPVPSGINIAQ